ncbi:MAG: FecR domain-containing protein [Rhodothermales bacterium]
MSDLPLPENDRDLQAARQLGKRLEEGATDGALDSLFEVLDAHKEAHRAVQADALPTPEISARMWQAIVEQVTATPSATARPPVPRQRLRSTFTRVSILASFLAVVALGWLILTRSNAPELLAEAVSDPVVYTTTEGSIITLRPHSKLFLLAALESEQRYQLDGEAYFDVVRDESRTFNVASGNALVSVLGTQFVVRNWGDDVEVFLKTGSVSLRHASSSSAVVLKPGELGRVNRQGAEIATASGSEEEALDWIDDELRFVQQPISRVVDELAFHFGIVIEFPQDRLAETISGTIILDSPRSALDQLGIATNSAGVQTGSRTYRFETRR